MEPSTLFATHPTAWYAALSGLISVIGALCIRYRRINASVERARLRSAVDLQASEAADRAAFRVSLMTEMAVARGLIKECETDRGFLRQRLNEAEAQIMILQASAEIMEKWVAFFRDGHI